MINIVSAQNYLGKLCEVFHIFVDENNNCPDSLPITCCILA